MHHAEIGLTGRNRLRPTVVGRTTMGRYKVLIGPRLHARGFAVQQTEAAIDAAVLNRMLAAGRPNSVRSQPVIG